jgi:hypothetical protein
MLILNTSHHRAWNISALSILALETTQCGYEGAIAAHGAADHVLQIVVLLVMIVVPAGLSMGVLGLVPLQLRHSYTVGFEHAESIRCCCRSTDCLLFAYMQSKVTL